MRLWVLVAVFALSLVVPVPAEPVAAAGTRVVADTYVGSYVSDCPLRPTAGATTDLVDSVLANVQEYAPDAVEEDLREHTPDGEDTYDAAAACFDVLAGESRVHLAFDDPRGGARKAYVAFRDADGQVISSRLACTPDDDFSVPVPVDAVALDVAVWPYQPSACSDRAAIGTRGVVTATFS